MWRRARDLQLRARAGQGPAEDPRDSLRFTGDFPAFSGFGRAWKPRYSQIWPHTPRPCGRVVTRTVAADGEKRRIGMNASLGTWSLRFRCWACVHPRWRRWFGSLPSTPLSAPETCHGAWLLSETTELHPQPSCWVQVRFCPGGRPGTLRRKGAARGPRPSTLTVPSTNGADILPVHTAVHSKYSPGRILKGAWLVYHCSTASPTPPALSSGLTSTGHRVSPPRAAHRYWDTGLDFE
jgi:hypothetical protein